MQSLINIPYIIMLSRYCLGYDIVLTKSILTPKNRNITMFRKIIEVSSRDTDALGHVNNTVLPEWFEIARNPFYKIFNPEMNLNTKIWNIIMVHIEIDYLNQTFFGMEVEIKTFVEEIGTTSCTVYQEAWQNNNMVAKARVILVHYDFNKEVKIVIPDSIRNELEKHLR